MTSDVNFDVGSCNLDERSSPHVNVALHALNIEAEIEGRARGVDLEFEATTQGEIGNVHSDCSTDVGHDPARENKDITEAVIEGHETVTDVGADIAERNQESQLNIASTQINAGTIKVEIS